MPCAGSVSRSPRSPRSRCSKCCGSCGSRRCRPGGSWLALKALPLALLWPGLSRGATKAGQWLALLLPLYVAEAIVRALTECGRHRLVAWTATVLAGMAFVAVLASFRAARRDRAMGR